MKTNRTLSFKTALLRLTALGVAFTLAACAGGAPPPRGRASRRPLRPHGDTLSQIAKRYGQNVNTLASWNNLNNASQIEVGQVLRVRKNVANRPRSGSTDISNAKTVTPVNRLTLQWPVDNGKNSIIRGYDNATNKGIDIGGTLGQSVKSAAAGTVIYVGEEVRGYGKLILISHNDFSITAYAHNDTILVQKDQKVAAGQPIATMGNTDTDGVKLHFEVRLNGKAVDPMQYLPG